MTEIDLKEITARGHVRIKGEAAPVTEVAPAPAAKPIIRQSSRIPNKTEVRFENDHLRPMRFAGEIGIYRFEDITLRIGNGCRYTPDYSGVNAAGVTVFFEVKGARIEEDAIVKLKAAASKYVEYEFWLCQWKEGSWNNRRVLP